MLKNVLKNVLKCLKNPSDKLKKKLYKEFVNNRDPFFP